MVISFGIVGFLVAINFIAFCGLEPCNLVDYMSFVGEDVTLAACNSVMYFDLYAFPLWFGAAVAEWLKCCATNGKVAGSIASTLLAAERRGFVYTGYSSESRVV